MTGGAVGDAPAAEWDVHVWLACGCGGNYTLKPLPVVGDLLWCYWHSSRERVTAFHATNRAVGCG